ncbi:MAG TPA: tetratricopeptide repeat protein [Verrucomicrobiae bacterium]|nr:tetratricopeptide repeat protein [Verrucomicrobiae bacterium]
MPTIVLFAVFAFHSASVAAQESVLLLTLHNSSGNKEFDHWESAIGGVLDCKLVEGKFVQIVPESSVAFAYGQLHFTDEQAVDGDRARRAGEFLNTHYVAWGDFTRQSDQWKLSMHSIDLKHPEPMRDVVVCSPNWIEVVSQTAEQMLNAWGFHPTKQEEAEADRLLPHSERVLELLSKAREAQVNGEALTIIEPLLQHAVALEPTNYATQIGLAQLLLAENKLDEAEAAVKAVIKDNSNTAVPHLALGTVYLAKGFTNMAESEFKEAIQVEPNYADSYENLGTFYGRQGKTAPALAALLEVEKLEPHLPNVRADAGLFEAMTGNREQALKELKQAEQEGLQGDPSLEYLLSEGYQTLNETPRAIGHYEAFLAAAKGAGVDPSDTKDAEERLMALKASQTVHFVTAKPPSNFSPQGLIEEQKRLLTPEELQRVVNPLACNEDMKRFAAELIGSETNQMEQARRLFNGLTQHLNTHVGAGERTAAEAFKALSDTNTALTCQDYTLLYVSLARSVGLQAYYVFVQKDYRDETVSHACAGIFIDGKGILVDPSFQWFGVPHVGYEFKDDCWVSACFMSTSMDEKTIDVGLKLAWQYDEILLFGAVELAQKGDFGKAHRVLGQALRLDSTNWMTLSCQASVAGGEKDWLVAIGYLQKSLSLNPHDPMDHYRLGLAYQNQGMFTLSRDEYQASLSGDLDAGLAINARRAIEQIDEYLKDKKPIGTTEPPP